MIVKLKEFEVKIKDEFTWGDAQAIQKSLMAGAKFSAGASNQDIDFNGECVVESTYITIERAVKEIKEIKSGKILEFSREWLDNLTISEGNKIKDAVDSLSKKNED
jgi:hypothetical protein